MGGSGGGVSGGSAKSEKGGGVVRVFRRELERGGGLTYFLAASMVSRMATGSMRKPR